MPHNDEKVLCINAKTINSVFTPLKATFLPASTFGGLSLISRFLSGTASGAPVVLPRSEAETNKEYKHLITYTVVNANGWIAFYRRGKSGGEDRLHDKWSIGIGGHITTDDIDPKYLEPRKQVQGQNAMAAQPIIPDAVYHAAALRELGEETEHGPGELVFVGLLSDNSTDVNSVHLGLVFEYRTLDGIKAKEDCLDSLSFASYEDISNSTNADNFESWSKILIQSTLRSSRHTSFGDSQSLVKTP